MQGRLSPRYKGQYQAFPESTWKSEFQVAHELGFDCIEFIFDYENYENNPLFSSSGLQLIQEKIDSTGVHVHSVCADYFMKAPLFVDDKTQRNKNIEILIQLLNNAAQLKITDITIPCVDESSMKSEEDKYIFKDSLMKLLPAAESCDVNLNLETDLSPFQFASLVNELNHPRVKINYDIGNSASLGYDAAEEIDVYGAYISVLHIKDRLLKGGSVKLGTGNANFEVVFKNLRRIHFSGIVVMQASRAQSDSSEIEYVQEQFAFLKNCLQRWWQ